jgi:alanine racemase
MSRPTFVTIDLEAIQHNLQRVRAMAPRSKVMAMVKANAYGHGAIRVAKALSDADALGVASIDEAIELREAGITQPIVLMEGLFQSAELAEAARYQFTLVVHHWPQVVMLEQANIKHEFPIWLKINSGMNRLGLLPTDAEDAYRRIMPLTTVKKPIGLMTHFAEADSLDHRATIDQMHVFNLATRHLSGPRSLANSAGILGWPDTHADWVRPGLMLYGAAPFTHQTGHDFDLRPAMTLQSQLIAINPVAMGSKVGYGGTWVAPHDMLLGVVAVGYGDGYPQFAKNGTPVLVSGVECPLVGRVSMDMMVVDLRKQPNAKIGDSVVLWGPGLPIERVARQSHTSAYEMFTRMTKRPKVQVRAGE